jgi:HPt (histidine-containing phosphotransfer) domain-containing protein
VLVVEADSNRASEIIRLLHDAGHTAFSARHGVDATRILRHQPVNLVIVGQQDDAIGWLDVVSNLRGDGGHISARYTPIYALVGDSTSTVPPSYIDGALPLPLDVDDMMAEYLRYLSDSLNGLKRGVGMAGRCEIDAAIDRLGGDVELHKDLVERFLNDTAGTRARLELAMEHANPGLVHNAAHSLKGLAASVGATSVAAALAELEQLGRDGDLTDLSTSRQRFRAEMERSAEELSQYHRRKTQTNAPTSVGRGI